MAHLENLDSDLDVILPHFKSADLKKTFPELNRSNGKNSTYTTFYHGLAASVLKPVLDKYRVDADMFGYTFDEYLEESDKHLLMSSWSGKIIFLLTNSIPVFKHAEDKTWHQSARFQNYWLPFWQIWMIFTHFKLWKLWKLRLNNLAVKG